MIFTFLKYIKPIWYFNLPLNNGKFIFPDPDYLAEEIKKYIIWDNTYESKEAMLRDASWQVFQKGYIGRTAALGFTTLIPIIDEYRFVRKHHKSIWATYCLLLRLMAFKNPLKELKAFYNTRHVQQEQVFENPIKHDNWGNFQSELIAQQPKISIIIPTLNRYPYLKDGLHDLEQQDYTNFEVIIIDQSEPFQSAFYNQFKLPLNVTYQKEKALWLARNTAIESSDADYLLLFDDDSRVESNWVSNHIKALDFFKADISSGQSISTINENLPINYQYFKVCDLLDTGNVLIRRNVFISIGLFDRQFEKQRMGDGEFGLRAYLNGFLNISNPYATRLHLKVGTGGLRHMGSWDAFRSKKWFSPKPIPSVLYLYRKYFGTKLTLFELLKSIPPSMIPYRFKKNKKMKVLGGLFSLVLLPIITIQILKSWYLSSKKIKNGAIIKELND